jgi:M6 family metalloprotease-like protein
MRLPTHRIFPVLGVLALAGAALHADQPPPRGKTPAATAPVEVTPPRPEVETLVEGLTGEWLSTARPIGAYEDLTAATGVAITGGLAEWATPLTDRVVQHVAGRTPGGDLHVFFWNASGVPQAVNISAKTGVRIAGDPVGWLGVTPHEHVAAVTPAGAVQLFTWTPASDWTSAEISAGSGKAFSGRLVAWTTYDRSPPVEHVAALTTAGEIQVFFRRGPAAAFTRVDLTARTGVRAQGLGGAWVAPDFSEHVVVAGTDSKLYELAWSSARDWTATAIPLPEDASADLTAVSNWGFATIAVRGARDTLFRLTRPITATGAWFTQDLTSFDGERVTGRPFVTPNNQFIAVRGVDGEALVFWPSGLPLWQVTSLSDLVGMTASGAPVGWIADGVAVAGTDNRLRVLRDWREARTLTEAVQAPFASLARQTGPRKTVTILWNPETTDANCGFDTGPGCLKPCDRTEIGRGVKLKFKAEAATAAMRGVGDYFREVSGDMLRLDNVATLGWYTSSKPGAHYWQDHGPGVCMDGWGKGGGDVEKWVEAIRKADAEFNFAAYDLDGDKTLRPNELAVVIMIPNSAGPAGFHRGVVAENGAALVVDGVTIPVITEVYVESREKAGSDFTDGEPDVGLIAHELSHHILGHVDMYWGRWDLRPPTGLGSHALMDNGWAGAHHDAWSKLKFNWLRPRIIWHPGRYALKDVETRHSARALLHPTRGAGEFLLFENRRRGTTFDRGLPADGLAIYHVMEDPAVYQRSRPPFHWTDAEWAKIAPSDWGHRALRLLRPAATNGQVYDGGSSDVYDDRWSLWRAGEARTSYDLTPFPASRGRAWLRWGDGANPGLAVRDVTAAGPEMRFTIATVSLANPGLCAAAGKNCGFIPDGYGGLASCGECSGHERCGGGGVPNVCGCTPKTCDDGYCGRLSDGCGGTLSCGGCDDLFFCNRWNRCEPIPEPCECGGRPPACLPCPRDPVAPPGSRSTRGPALASPVQQGTG